MPSTKLRAKPRSWGSELIVSAGESCRRLLETRLELFRGGLVDLCDRRTDGGPECPGNHIGLVMVVDRDDPRRAGWQRVVHLLADPRLYALARDLADDAAGRRSDGRGREERGREEAHDETYSSADLDALASQVVARLLHRHLTLRVLGDEHHPVGRDRPLPGELHEHIEIFLCEIGDQVDGDQNVQLVVVAHDAASLSVSAPRAGPLAAAVSTSAPVGHDARGD